MSISKPFLAGAAVGAFAAASAIALVADINAPVDTSDYHQFMSLQGEGCSSARLVQEDSRTFAVRAPYNCIGTMEVRNRSARANPTALNQSGPIAP